MNVHAFSPSLRSKLFPRSSPNPNECTHERSKSTRTLIHKSQRFQNKADGLYLTTPVIRVPSNFMANRQVPKFSSNNCAQSSKKAFMCPKFHTTPVFKYTKCHISTNVSSFLKLCLLNCQKLFALPATNRRFAEKIRLSGNTACNTIYHRRYGCIRE